MKKEESKEKIEEEEEEKDNSNKRKQDNSEALEIELDDEEETTTTTTATDNSNKDNNKEEKEDKEKQKEEEKEKEEKEEKKDNNNNNNRMRYEESKEIEVNPFKNRNHVSPYLFVGGISRDLEKSELEKIFKEYGEVMEIEQPEVKHGYKLAHIFVNYKTVEEAKCAVNGLKNHRERGFAWNLQYSHGKKTFQLKIECEGKMDKDELKEICSKKEKVEKIEEVSENVFIVSYESTAAAGRALNELEKKDKV